MKPELKYGLLAGAGTSAWIMTEYLLGLHTTRLAVGAVSGYFSSLVILLCLWRMLRAKQAAYGPMFNLRHGLWSGLYASLAGAVVVYGFLVLYNQVIHPGWLDHAMQWKVDRLRADGIAEDEIRRQLDFYRRANQPVGLLLTTLVGTTLMGGIMSLVITITLMWRGQKAS